MAKAMWMGFEVELWASSYSWHLLAPTQFHGHTRGLGDFEMAWGGQMVGTEGQAQDMPPVAVVSGGGQAGSIYS